MRNSDILNTTQLINLINQYNVEIDTDITDKDLYKYQDTVVNLTNWLAACRILNIDKNISIMLIKSKRDFFIKEDNTEELVISINFFGKARVNIPKYVKNIRINGINGLNSIIKKVNIVSINQLFPTIENYNNATYFIASELLNILNKDNNYYTYIETYELSKIKNTIKALDIHYITNRIAVLEILRLRLVKLNNIIDTHIENLGTPKEVQEHMNNLHNYITNLYSILENQQIGEEYSEQGLIEQYSKIISQLEKIGKQHEKR